MKTYTIPQYEITVTVGDNGAGVISSELKNQLLQSFYILGADENDSGSQYYEGLARAHALESFILALACQGYDISEPKFIAALQSSLEAIVNNS
ncbi:MAG: hypothetical protein IMZ61_11550 [Planctomycetes bacterium]|nr:hypothetical protein [Planctomycetota bacterium]